MSKKKKLDNNKIKLVKSINNNIRSSTRKLNPILKGLVGKKSRCSNKKSYIFRKKNNKRYQKKLFLQQLLMQKIIFNMI